jgi:hypothetical protein
MTAVQPATGTSIVAVNLGIPSDLRGLARFVSTLGDEYPGDLLLVNGKTGAIVSGSQGYEHKPGEQFAVFVGELQSGLVMWVSGKLVKQSWWRAADPDIDEAAMRASLGYTDREQWKFNARGEREDPFKPRCGCR